RAFDSVEQLKAQPEGTIAAAASIGTPAYTSALRERGGDAMYQGRNLPPAHGIKPEFANSGRWIAQPGS
ncbi:MAG: cell wall hydrolase, partial [Novosphingobium sp.]